MSNPSPTWLDYVIAMGSLAFVLAAVVYVFWRSFKKSQDRMKLVSRWILTLFDVPILLIALQAGVFTIPIALIGGLLLALIWTPSITAMMAKPFGALYYDQESEADTVPSYDIAQARRKVGKYQEAIEAIQAELANFPTDFKGQLLLAEIQADDLKDMAAAQATIESLLQQPGHPEKNVVFALNRLADWHLKHGNQMDAAKTALEWVRQMYPDTESAYLAGQRLVRLDTPDEDKVQTQKFVVKEQKEYVGLNDKFEGWKPETENTDTAVQKLVKRLESHPIDNEARERLASYYALNYNNIELATDQLNQLIAQPGVPQKLVVHWLNLLADLQIHANQNLSVVQATLNRIKDTYPNTSDAEKAKNRLTLINIEYKARQEPSQVKMGSYEQNLGLKPGFVPPNLNPPS